MQENGSFYYLQFCWSCEEKISFIFLKKVMTKVFLTLWTGLHNMREHYPCLKKIKQLLSPCWTFQPNMTTFEKKSSHAPLLQCAMLAISCHFHITLSHFQSFHFISSNFQVFPAVSSYFQLLITSHFQPYEAKFRHFYQYTAIYCHTQPFQVIIMPFLVIYTNLQPFTALSNLSPVIC